MVKNTYCSCRRPGFDSQYTHGDSKSIFRYQAGTLYSCIHAGKAHLRQIIFLKVKKAKTNQKHFVKTKEAVTGNYALHSYIGIK